MLKNLLSVHWSLLWISEQLHRDSNSSFGFRGVQEWFKCRLRRWYSGWHSTIILVTTTENSPTFCLLSQSRLRILTLTHLIIRSTLIEILVGRRVIGINIYRIDIYLLCSLPLVDSLLHRHSLVITLNYWIKVGSNSHWGVYQCSLGSFWSLVA